MSPIPDDLTTVKDDMIAFIEGHGMRRFHGYVDFEEVQCVMWEAGSNPDGWKDFVELAKSSGAPFLTMHAWTLEREELDGLLERLHPQFTFCLRERNAIIQGTQKGKFLVAGLSDAGPHQGFQSRSHPEL